MKIAFASGKGGTGKTTVAVNLAYVISQAGSDVTYLDCDVEEPNGHLFLNPVISKKRSVNMPVPEVDESKCTGCGLCAKICQYKSIAALPGKVLVFPELCHGCGGCMRVCPEKAITETGREIGVLEIGSAGRIGFVHGKLRVGEAMSPPLIREVKKEITDRGIHIIDVPPGTSCPVITAIRDTDFVALVTEPTPFGLYDLGLALDMVNELKLPHGVVVNRHEEDNLQARIFCKQRNVPILAEIPDDRRVAEAYSVGKIASAVLPEFSIYFTKLRDTIRKRVKDNCDK